MTADEKVAATYRTMRTEALRSLRYAFTMDRSDALQHHQPLSVEFCDERVRLIDVELERRREDGSLDEAWPSDPRRV